MKTRFWMPLVSALMLVLAPACQEAGVRQTRPIMQLEIPATPDDPAITCELDSCAIDFGQVYLGNSTSRTVIIGNAGDGNLSVVSVAIDPASDHFSVAAVATQAVAPGADLALEVFFSPQLEGAHQGTLAIASDDPQFPLVEISLSGTSRSAPMPQLQVCLAPDPTDPDADPSDCVPPHALAFGDTALVPLGDPVPTPVVLRNLGEEILILHQVGFTADTTAEFSLDTNPTGLQIPAYEPGSTPHEIALTLYYTPIDGGEDDGQLQILSNDPDNREVYVDLSGRGIAPRICSDPLTLEFGQVAINYSTTRSFKISNCGLLNLTIGTINFHDQSSPEFAFAALPLTPFDLAPGEDIDIEVIYTPINTGPDGARVYMQSNDPAAESGYILLQGEGSDQPICDVALVPARLNFGMVPMGDTASRTVSIRNQGTADCHMADIGAPQGEGGAAFVLSSLPLLPFTIGAGEQQSISVLYSPNDPGPHRATVTVTSDDFEEPQTSVDLYGNDPDVPECNIDVVPTALAFGTVALWRTVLHEVTIKNIGAEPCILASLDFLPGSNLDSFTLAEYPSLPAQIPPHEETSVLVGFTPLNRGVYTGTLSIVSNDPDTPVHMVDLSGSGEELNLMVIPDSVDFGRVTVGCSSPEFTVTVYNIGSSAVTINSVYLDAVNTDPEFSMIALNHGGLTSPPFTLTSADSFTMKLRYVPQMIAANHGILVVESTAALGAYMEVPLLGEGTDISEQTDVFNQLDHPMVDVLWVIDNSGSMSPYQQALAQNFATFINWAITLDTDFHIGVISTEINEPETPADFFNVYPGILVFFPGYDKILDNNTPNVVQAFSRNVNVGTCCSDEQESGLHAAMMALSEPLVSATAANGGFLREESKLVMIMVSDEPDQSPAPVDFYVDFFKDLKGARNDQLMDVSVIIDESYNAQPRYKFAAQETGGLIRDLSDAWGSTLSDLGLDAFAARTQFPLTRPANPSTIVVTIDNHDGNGPQDVPLDADESGDGFTYDANSNSIIFGDDVVPGRGATIEVTYDTVCL